MTAAYFQLLKERGLPWVVNRVLYSLKLKTLCQVPAAEKLFEKKIPEVKRIDLFDVDVAAIKAFLLKLPMEKREAIIEEADAACRGRIRGFSSVGLDYGNPIHWQLNPMTGQCSDCQAKWYRIPDFDPKRGDIKIIWEISRFSHFFLLARAFLLTDNIRYYHAFSEQLAHWLKENPYTYGANFKCGQECALRMLCCLMVYPIFAGQATPEDVACIKDLVSRCYRKILSNFFYAYKCQKNNHALSETAGMIAGAWCCGDRPRLQRAYSVLEKIIKGQFDSDGGYIQQSFNYQRLALQDIEAILCMSKKTGCSLSEQARQRVLKSALQMYQCQDESGDMPNYGSNDGALIFPVTVCGYRDFTPVINTAYALLCGKRLFDSGPHEEELLWFGAGLVLGRDHIPRVSCAYPETGLYTLRKPGFWGMVAAKKNINHMDQNHFDLWVDGVNVLCDSGTFSYASELGNELHATQAHNTVYCRGREQIKRIGQFAVYGQPRLKNISWTASRFSAEIQFQSGYAHRRSITLTDFGCEIFDETDCGEAEVLFHTPGGVEKSGEGMYTLPNGCTIDVGSDAEISPTKRSLYYLKLEDAYCLRVRMDGNKALTKIHIQNNG